MKWDDDELISDMPSLLDVSPTYVGTTVTCEVVKVGRCGLTVSKPVLKAPMVSAISA